MQEFVKLSSWLECFSNIKFFITAQVMKTRGERLRLSSGDHPQGILYAWLYFFYIKDTFCYEMQCCGILTSLSSRFTWTLGGRGEVPGSGIPH